MTKDIRNIDLLGFHKFSRQNLNKSLMEYQTFKGTVSVISSDPPCKDSNARFTDVPLTLI